MRSDFFPIYSLVDISFATHHDVSTLHCHRHGTSRGPGVFDRHHRVERRGRRECPDRGGGESGEEESDDLHGVRYRINYLLVSRKSVLSEGDEDRGVRVGWGWRCER